MLWSVKLLESKVAVYKWSTLDGYYNLIEKPCKVCSYPLPESSTICERSFTHSAFLKKIYTVGVYYPYGQKLDYLSKHINNLKSYIQKAEPLGLAISELIRLRDKELLEYDFLVPIPQEESEMHEDKVTGEEFNQVNELARYISDQIGVPIADCITKVKAHSQQSRTFVERSSGTMGLYRCKSNELEGKTVLLIDDVTTSGYTLKRCTEELLKDGAKEVRAYVCGINNYQPKS